MQPYYSVCKPVYPVSVRVKPVPGVTTTTVLRITTLNVQSYHSVCALECSTTKRWSWSLRGDELTCQSLISLSTLSCFFVVVVVFKSVSRVKCVKGIISFVTMCICCYREPSHPLPHSLAPYLEPSAWMQAWVHLSWDRLGPNLSQVGLMMWSGGRVNELLLEVCDQLKLFFFYSSVCSWLCRRASECRNHQIFMYVLVFLGNLISSLHASLCLIPWMYF